MGCYVKCSGDLYTRVTAEGIVRIRLRRALSDMRMSTVTLAEKTGVSYVTLNSILKGERAVSQKSLHKICESLELDEKYIKGYDTLEDRFHVLCKHCDDLEAGEFIDLLSVCLYVPKMEMCKKLGYKGHSYLTVDRMCNFKNRGWDMVDRICECYGISRHK